MTDIIADEQPSAEPTSVNDEIAAMRKLVNALDSLDPATQRRVLQWLTARYADLGTAA